MKRLIQLFNIKRKYKVSEYNRIKELVLSKGYMFFEEGNYNLNFIWERTSDEYTNMFTDKLHILYLVCDVEKIITIPATTKPGLKGAILNPVTVGGVTGTSVICPGQYRSSWQYSQGLVGAKYPWSSVHFRQVRPISYWRDGNKDLKIDEEQFVPSANVGTHWHIMEEPVNNWSLGCMGISASDMLSKVDPIVKVANLIWGDIYTGTIIETYK